jgi:hypothetical protein
LGRNTTIAYTQDANGLHTATTVTNPAGHVTTTTLDPAWGEPVTRTDANLKVTTACCAGARWLTSPQRPPG